MTPRSDKADRVPRYFGDLAGAEPQPVRLQGSIVILRPYGCTYCGHAFWTEDDPVRRLPPGPHACPRCGEVSIVPGPPGPLPALRRGQHRVRRAP